MRGCPRINPAASFSLTICATFANRDPTAVEAKGLWEAEHLGGSLFRGWMSIKNAWVPVKLALSMFHLVHVLGIDAANSFSLAWEELAKGRSVERAFQAAARLPGVSGSKQGMEAKRAIRVINSVMPSTC